jgi:large subunit ribosomal protein L35
MDGRPNRRRSNSLPKLKTHKGAKRRFGISGSGKFMRRKGNISHFKRRKANRAKGDISEMVEVSHSMRKQLRRLLPYG